MYDYTTVVTALTDDVGDLGDTLYSDMSLETANKVWLSQSLMKKFMIDGKTPTRADEKCLELFKSSNEHCRQFDLRPSHIFDDVLIGEVKTSFDNYAFSGPDLCLDLSRISAGFDIGPGASLGAKSYNFYTKLFDSDLTSTSTHLYRLYREAIRSDPLWSNAEESRYARFGARVVVGNRLSFVPKTSEVSRAICTEPNLNMLFQKGIGSFFEEVLKKRFRIDLSYQPELNRRLAQQGSLDGSFGTIDLSCASDSMSLTLLKKILPPYLFRWLVLSRSPSVIFPDGTGEELHMISSMGNAFTFPLQTLLFSTIVACCYRILGVKPLYGSRGPKNFAVFGDDIIVRKDCYDFIVHSLKLFGFTVNETKSFNCGWFRESCGGDYWKGTDIRGVYLRSLTSSADVYSALNRVVRWSARTGVMLPSVFKSIRSMHRGEILYVPAKDGDAEGFKTPYPVDSRFISVDRGLQCIKYSALTQKSRSLELPDDPASVRYYPSKGRRFPISHNADGKFVTLLAGHLRNGRVGLRSFGASPPRFKVRSRVTSSWGGDVFPVDANLVYRINLRTTFSINVFCTAGALKMHLGDQWKLIAELYLNLI